jgi:hypothetical protein
VGTSKASVPVVAAQAGVALRYSKNLVLLFLEADGVLTPSAMISGPEYDGLQVLD